MAYNDFIQNILDTRGRFNCDGYKERHHIIPKCMGGTDDDDNLIDLYAQEHFVAHKMLAMENQDNHKLAHAFWRMCQLRARNNLNIEVSPDDYAEARKLHAQAMSDRKISETTRQKFSNNMKGELNPMYGMYGDKNPCYGRRHTDEERQKMSANHVDMSGVNNPMYGLRGDKSPHAKPVYCLELNKVFGSILSAAEFIGVHKSSIGACLRGKQKTAGVNPETGERLHWSFVEDLI